MSEITNTETECRCNKDGWIRKKLGEVLQVERGGSPRPISAFLTDSEDGINWIKIGDAIDGNKYISQTKEKIIPEGIKKSRLVHKGDFILSNSMSFGKPYILKIDGCIHDGWLVLHDEDNVFDKIWLYYYLGSPFVYREFQRMAEGGVVNNLNSSLVRNLNILIPPKEEQHRIVSELECLNGIIEKQKEQLKQLDELAQSIFYDMFGDPVENEKGWEVSTFGKAFQISSGGTPSTKNTLYWSNGNIPWIGSNMCQNSIIYVNDGKFITSEGLSNSSAKIYNYGFVLVALVGATIGKTALLRMESATNQNIAGINVPANINFTSEFIFYLLQNLYSLFLNISEGKFKMANLKFIRELPLIVPPLSLQQSFAQKIEAIERQKELIKQSIAETETLFNSRMDYYFG